MTPDFAELISKATDGCRTSLERLLMANYSRLHRYLKPKIPKVLDGVAGPDDIVQQAFTQVFLKIDTFEGTTEAAFNKWMNVIADNQLQDAIKLRMRKKRGGERRRVMLDNPESGLQLLDLLSADQSTASRQLSKKEALQAMHVCIAELPEDYRDVIRLRYFEGASVPEIAKQLNKSTGAIRGILDRARAKLRDGMGRASQWLSHL